MPAGTPTAAHSMMPPMLSASNRAASISALHFFSALGELTAKKRVFKAFKSSFETFTGSNGVSFALPTA